MNKNVIQELLEKDACKKNGGICESYEYCRFCKEPKKLYRTSNTPCADAYIDLKDITNSLKRYKENKEYIKIAKQRVVIWRNELNTKDPDELLDWFSDLKKTDTFGMPKGKGAYISPDELKVLGTEHIRERILYFIKAEESRIFSVELDVAKVEYGLNRLSNEERFIIECRHFENMTISDIVDSYIKLFQKGIAEETIRNKILIAKKKLLQNFKKFKHE